MQLILAEDDGTTVATYQEVTPDDAATVRIWTIVNWLVEELKAAAARKGAQS